MAQARIQVVFENGTGQAQVWEDTVQLDRRGEPGGEQKVANHLIIELRKELSWGNYHDSLPDLTGLLGVPKQTFRAHCS